MVFVPKSSAIWCYMVTRETTGETHIALFLDFHIKNKLLAKLSTAQSSSFIVAVMLLMKIRSFQFSQATELCYFCLKVAIQQLTIA